MQNGSHFHSLNLLKIYMKLLGKVIHWHRIKYHQYVDDTQSCKTSPDQIWVNAFLIPKGFALTLARLLDWGTLKSYMKNVYIWFWIRTGHNFQTVSSKFMHLWLKLYVSPSWAPHSSWSFGTNFSLCFDWPSTLSAFWRPGFSPRHWVRMVIASMLLGQWMSVLSHFSFLHTPDVTLFFVDFWLF